MKLPGPALQPLRALAARVDALTPRERVILFITGLVLVWGLADTLLLGPGQRQRQELSRQLAELGQRATAAQQALDVLAARPDRKTEAARRRDALRQDVMSRLQAAATLRGHLVEARDMPRVLENLLARQSGLRLVSLKTLAPEPIAAATDAADPNAAAYFRHGVELTLEGGYAALTSYLRGLEQAPLGVLWASADLDASDHPHLRLTLVVYTLSENRTWLKV